MMTTQAGKFFIGLLLILGMTGTTYIIKEGGVEVGRWEEADGSDKIEIIENEKPAFASESLKTAAEERRAPVAEWKVSGKLVDMITLKRLSGGEIIFTPPAGLAEPVNAAVYPEGGFSARLPALEGGEYLITVNPPPGYHDRPTIFLSGSLSKISYRNRLSGRGGIPFGQSDSISKTVYDIEIGLYSFEISQQERRDYQRIVLGINPGNPEAHR